MKAHYLNLLSPHRRVRLKRIARLLFIRGLAQLALITCVLLAITYLFGWLVLTDTINNLAASSLLLRRDYPLYNSDIQSLNKVSREVVTAATDYSPTVPLLQQLINALPPDIKLNSISLDRKDKTLHITGTAKTRDALINYTNTILALPWIADATAPTSQLFQKDNVDFELQATLKIKNAQ